MRIRKLGSGPSKYIFLHGGGVRYNSYLPLIRSMAKVGTVYYFNLPGYGNRMQNYELTAYLNEITSFIQDLGLINATLIGHYFDGYCAFQVGR